MNLKGAISLSINLLVIIIISLAIFSGGIILLYKFMAGAEEIKGTLDTQTQQQLERLLVEEGKKVALPSHLATLHAGESHVFGLGILNINSEKYGNDFKIEVNLSQAYDEKNQPLFKDDENKKIEIEKNWLLYYQDPLTIEENQHHSEPILVNVPKVTPKGTYIFNVKVLDGNDKQYDTTKKFTVVVK